MSQPQQQQKQLQCQSLQEQQQQQQQCQSLQEQQQQRCGEELFATVRSHCSSGVHLAFLGHHMQTCMQTCGSVRSSTPQHHCSVLCPVLPHTECCVLFLFLLRRRA
jgi:hypothetical protein